MKESTEENREESSRADHYPPLNHILRDLRMSLKFQSQGRAVIRAPVVPEILTPGGSLQAGAVATIVDILGGALTFRAVYPDWMATAALSIHLSGRPASETVAAAGEVIRVGRTMAIIDVDIREEEGAFGEPAKSIGTGMVSGSRLPRRDNAPVLEAAEETSETVHFGIEGSGLNRPFRDAAGVRVLDETEGVVELDLQEYVRNSVGVLQGGMIAILSDTAGEMAAGAEARRPMTTRDLTIQYLSQGKRGPFRTRARVVRATQDTALARVEVIDRGMEDRLIAVVMNTAVADSKVD
jgi:uncharacterized protein (TIGR00369 family)